MARISKSQLLTTVAETNNITKVQAEAILDTVLDAITGAISQGESVHLGNDFGTFAAKQTNAMVKKNPATQEPINVPAKQVIKFVPSKALKSAVNK